MKLQQSTPVGQWTEAQQLTALCESYAFKEQAPHAWCRENGLYEHQLHL
jgi:hypothetical protein